MTWPSVMTLASIHAGGASLRRRWTAFDTATMAEMARSACSAG
ncbi:MAG: hypothetical protein ACRDZR_08630 [Acidimicrobiales bacterium]